MKIHCIEDASEVQKVNDSDKFIILNFKVKYDEFVVVNGVFYEQETAVSEEGINKVRKCDEVNGINGAEIEILDMLMANFEESADLNVTLDAFRNLTKERFEKSLFELIQCVKRHGKITEDQAKLLFDLLSGNKTKKQVLDKKICTYKEIERAFYSFRDEMQWCYGYNNVYIEHRVQQFFRGDIEFVWTPSSFLLEYNLKKEFLENLFKKIFRCKKFINPEDREAYSILIEKFLNDTLIEQEERIKLINLCNSVVAKCKQDLWTFYSHIAKILIYECKVYVKDINEYSELTGCCKRKIRRAMRIAGVEPVRYINRHDVIRF